MRTTTAVRTASLPLLVTRRELVAAGIDLDIALRATRRGSWTEVVPGAWWRAPVDVTRGLRQAAALQLLGPAAALTGVDACQHYGLRDVPEDGRVDVVVHLWLVGTGLGAELDSVRHHGSYDALDATLDRHERAAACGIVLVHRSPRRLRADPAGLVDELVRRLPDCPAPPGLVVVPQGPVLPGPRRRR